MEIAFFLGLLSAWHCFGMCGGIVGALTLSLPPEKRGHWLKIFPYVSAYNLGRLSSYALAGLLFGLGGEALMELMPGDASQWFRIAFNSMVILLGFYLAGWLPRLALIEKVGTPLWKRLQPIGIKFLPVKSLPQAYLFGVIWGWIPCGLVYYALMLAFTQQELIQGMWFMLMFGLGTLIPMMLTGVLSGQLLALRHAQWLRLLNGSLLILVGVLGLLHVVDFAAF